MGRRGPNAKPTKQSRQRIARAKLPAYLRDEPEQPDVLTSDHEWANPGLSRVDRVIAFLETLPVTSGTLAGSSLKVREWQRDIIQRVYGPAGENGRRLVREALVTIPRKNGKTGLAAGLGLCHLVGPEAVPRGQVYSAAAERKQAALLFDEMKAIVLKVGWMAERVVIRDFNKQLEDDETGSIFIALSSEAKTKHGLSASCWIYDELAQAPDRKLYDVLSTSTGARDEPLGIVISTQSPDPMHIMSELVDYGEQVRDGVVDDPSFCPVIYSAPDDADPWDEATWHGCNPALGDFRSIEEMRDSARKAQRMPAREATFRLLYLNQRRSDEKRFLPRSVWDARRVSVDPDDLRGKSCVGGLDLSGSGRDDLTSLVLLFDLGDKHFALPFFWSAEDALEEAESRDKVPYRLWRDQGHLRTTPGRVLKLGFIAAQIGELTGLYDIEAVAVDPWNIERLIVECDEHGVDLVFEKHGQGYQQMDPSVRALEQEVLSEQLQHPGNPVLGWSLDNVKVTMDSSGNRKFDKRKSTGRIDGAVALAMAAGLLDAGDFGSVYETQGIAFS